MRETVAVDESPECCPGSPPFAALCGAALLVLTGVVQAAQDAHEHGQGELNVVVEGAALGLELRVPGVDVVGFEHKAHTAQEKAAVAAALGRFSSPGKLFAPSAAAKCTMIRTDVSLDGEHAVHGEGKEGEHGHAEKHAHEHDADHAQDAHSELHAEYHFECAEPKRLRSVIVNAFDLMSAESLRAAVVTEQRQTFIELTPTDRTIDLQP